MAFKGKDKSRSGNAASPLDLYTSGGLPRTQEAVPGLWHHQGVVLGAWHSEHANDPDVALELPTGTGKTVTGLLIAEWVRREYREPVAYVCPTTQLAGQVIATAAREGVPGVLLAGPSRDWPVQDEVAYSSGDAIAVTNYSTVFNSNPRLAAPRLLVFDDAHAGEQYVGGQYAIEIRRSREQAAYLSVLNALAPLLSGLQLQRLSSPIPDPGAHHQVRLLLPALVPDALEALDATLAQLPKPHNYSLAMIRSGLKASCVYLSYGGLQIRPMVPPTFGNPVFSGAVQRLYLSATLGSGGELERSFGRSGITRLPLPSEAKPRSGRRLFVFPDVAKGSDGEDLVRRLVALTGKALVLTQDTTDAARDAAAAVAPDGVPVLGKDDVAGGLGAFSAAPTGVLGLANRYDGLDLPGDACRMVVLDGLPSAVTLQEKFLGERADARAALAERVRTRVVQGAGRCTRQPNDFAVVVVRGTDLTRYLARPDVQAALDPELQAEVEFGWDNSRGQAPDDVLDNVRVFLEHGAEWRAGGEQALAEFRDEAEQAPAAGSDALQASAPLEVQAWALACQEDWPGASALLQQAAREVGKGGDATRGYRAVLLYLAGVWLHHGATGEAERGRARDLVRQAGAASVRGVWLKEMRALPSQAAEALPEADRIAVNAVAAVLSTGVRADRHQDARAAMLDGLSQDEAGAYERGLTALGGLLGADASKPAGTGRCDSAWLWGDALWMSLEAKSEEEAGKTLPLKDIRQANTQLDQIAIDRGMPHPPADSSAVLVSDRLTVDPAHAGTANPNVFLTGPHVVYELAGDAAQAWAALVPGASGQSAGALRDLVERTLREFGCLPSQAQDRLTQNRIRPGI